MLSDNKTSSPIVQCSTDNVDNNIFIEESEVESSESDVEESIPGSPGVACSPLFQVFLKLKPKSKEVQNDAISVNQNSYEILDSTTLRTRFTPINSAKKSRPSSTVSKIFKFSKIFESHISQAEFFEQTVKQRLVEFLTGQNSTIITYGATNSGKTYTLYGTPDQPGLIPRSIEFIFSAITCTLMPWYKFNPNNTLISLDDYERSDESSKKDRLLRSQIITKDKFTEARRSLENSELSNENKECYGESMYAVWLSFAEIYNENIYDLLDFNDSTKSRPLKLISEKNGLTHVKGLTTIYATTAFEACQILMAGQSRMSTAFTTLNPKSSRSHTIFTMGLVKYQKAYAPHEAEASTLTFCDLAASGRSKQADECKTRLAETRNINNSLLVLGRCLKRVYEKQLAKQSTDNASGPFRESKLTRIFQRALSGHEHITFLINIDPSSDFVNETQSILNISAIARKIAPEMKESKKSARETVDSSKIPDTKINLDDISFLNSSINEDKENQSPKTEIVKAERSSTLQEETLKAALLKRELEVRQELANHYNKVIERMEETWKERTKEVEEEGKDLLKWSVDQVESFYKERIDNIMYAKKRKRDELSCDDKEQENKLYEELLSANIRSKLEICTLKDALKKLQDENRGILAEKNADNFEIALLKKELTDFQNLAKSEISKSNFIDDSNSLPSTLKRLIDDKNRYIEILQADLRTKYFITKDDDETVSEKSLNSKDMIHELKEELSKKSADIRILKEKLECYERELYRTEAACKEAEDKNLLLLQQIEAFDSDMKQIERKCTESSTPKPPYYLEEASIKKLVCQLDQNDQDFNSRMSSIVSNDSFFGDAAGEPGNFIVQAHIDIKVDNLNDRRNLSKGTSSNTSGVESKSLFSSSGNDFRSSDASSKNDSGIVAGSKCYSKVSEIETEILEESFGSNIINGRKLSEYRKKLLFKEKEFERLKEENLQIIEKYKEVSESLDTKSQEYERDTNELTEKLKFVEESKDVILACLQTCAEENACLERKLSDIMTNCRENHLQKLQELERKLLVKISQVDEANNKIVVANRDLEKLNDLMERLHKLTNLVDQYQKEKDDLHEQLLDCLKVQNDLETKLKCFCSLNEKTQERICNIQISDACNGARIMTTHKSGLEVGYSVAEMQRNLLSMSRELRDWRKSRKDLEKIMEQRLNDLQLHIKDVERYVPLALRALEDLENKEKELYDKEEELSLCKKNHDITIKKYDLLVEQLQEELKKFRESSLTDKKSTNCSTMDIDDNRKSAYLTKKLTDEKSVKSTSTFSVSKVSSFHRANVGSIPNDQELNDETQSSQTESDIDSDESDSSATSGTSAKTNDDFEATPCRFVRRSCMSRWMRMNIRTTLPGYSDVEHDGDRSDS